MEWMSLEVVQELQKLCNFQVEDFHTYHIGAEGVLVHNASEEYGGGVAKPQVEVSEGGYDSVHDIIKNVENGDISLTNNIQKGNYGEMKMDTYFEKQGYERISVDRVTDLNTPTHQGIDGVYYNQNGKPPEKALVNVAPDGTISITNLE